MAAVSKTQTAGRIFRVVRLVLEAPAPCGFADIQKALGLPKSTLSGMLGELVSLGVLALDEGAKTYHAGSAFITMSALCLSRVNTAQEIALVLNAEARKHKHAGFHAGILSGASMVYIYESAGIGPLAAVRFSLPVLPAHACALGKALLATLEEQPLAALYENYAFEQFTEHTIQSHRALAKELDTTRKQGYATDRGELSPFVACLALALPNTGGPACAISMTVPMGRFGDGQAGEMLAVLRAARDEISARMGILENPL